LIIYPAVICYNFATESVLARKQEAKLELLSGTLDMMVLRTLLAGPANGYEIAKAIERSSEDVLGVDHGSLYPALHRLEKGALVSGKWEISTTNRKARYYRLTARGRKQLLLEQSKWERMSAAISAVMRPV
jgi:PadR family transcriptional regulator, regulatory protein PadR